MIGKITYMVNTNKEIRSAIIGMVCGDGFISKNSDLRINHCLRQKEYLEYKKNILQHKQLHEIKLVDYVCHGYPGVRLCTRVRPIYRILRKVFYPNGGKKIISRKILNYLTPVGLAIWYQDDGGLSAKKRDGKIRSYEVFLNTHLTKEDNQIIIDYFKEKWDIRWTQVKNKGWYRLRMGTREGRKFVKIIKDHIVQCMKYKVFPLLETAPDTENR